MKRGIYAIRDNRAGEVVGNLMMFAHDAPAIRMFGDAVSAPDSMVAKHTADYDLILCGRIEIETGVITSENAVVMTGVTFLAMREAQEAEAAQ